MPITRLNFGRIVQQSSSGAHTLGRFECTGQSAVSESINGMPKSCADLKQNGHTANGLYLIMGTEKVETVFCDLSLFFRNSSKSIFTSFSTLIVLLIVLHLFQVAAWTPTVTVVTLNHQTIQTITMTIWTAGPLSEFLMVEFSLLYWICTLKPLTTPLR